MLPELEKRSIEWLKGNISRVNIAEDFSEDVLSAIGGDVIANYDIDVQSRTDWVEQTEKGLKIAKQEVEPRAEGWMANNKDPLIAIAANQFAARAGGELIRGRDVVKAQVTGKDDDGAKELRSKRVSDCMSFLCLEEMEDWEQGTDQLLNSVSITGCYYKKTFFDTLDRSYCSYAISPLKIVVHNDAKSLNKTPRITEELEFTKNDAVERIRGGVWLDIEAKMEKDDDGLPEEFLEQHCWYDLDGDGYKEPYVVVVHAASKSVCRIAARYKKDGITIKGETVRKIKAHQYYTKFSFLPAPDATYHDMGWAHQLGPLVETKQAILNQIQDAGTLANIGGGFVARGARVQGGVLKFRLNEWKPVEATGQQLRDAFFPNPAKEPSGVLFNLLQMLDEKGMRLASISDAMTGDQPNEKQPATTTLALLDQGLKVFTSILRRLYRSSKDEYKKLYALIYENMTDAEYRNIIDDPTATVKADFNPDDCDIQPVADPTAASEAIRLAIANAIIQALPGNPNAQRYYLKAIGVKQKDVDDMIPPVDPKNPPPNPEMIKLQADIAEKGQKGELDTHRVANDAERIQLEKALLPYKQAVMEATALNLKATAEANLAKSEATQVSTHINVFKTQLDEMQQNFEQGLALLQHQLERMTANATTGDAGARDDAGGSGGVEEGQQDAQDSGVSQGQAPADSGGSGGGGVSQGDGGIDGAGVLQPDGSGGGGQPHPTPGDVSQAGLAPGAMK